jgi:hypothetical protein
MGRSHRVVLDRAEFTPAEAEKITGVSVALQRDWRRRKIIHGKTDGGWTKFLDRDLCELITLKKFSDNGFYVKQASHVTALSIGPLLTWIHDLGGVAFDASVPEEMKDRGRPQGMDARFVMVAKTGDGEDAQPQVARFSTLEGMENYREKQIKYSIENEGAAPPPAAFVVLDLAVIASELIGRADRPLSRWIAEEIEGDEE